MPTGYEARDRLKSWIRQETHRAAETIGYDLQDVAEEERAAALADFAADKMYSATGEMAEAFRLMEGDKRRQLVTLAAEEYSL